MAAPLVSVPIAAEMTYTAARGADGAPAAFTVIYWQRRRESRRKLEVFVIDQLNGMSGQFHQHIIGY